MPPRTEQATKSYNFLIYIMLIGLSLSWLTHVVDDKDEMFRDAVENEYYLTADICHSILKADPNRSRTLYLILSNHHTADDAKTRQVEYLLQKGADPNRFSSIFPAAPATPISMATVEENRHLLPRLLEHCKKISSLDAMLTAPVRDGDEKAVRMLLKYGAEVHLCDAHGKTALHWAADPMHEDEAKALEITRLLLQAGAAVNAPYLTHYPPFAQTALDLAERHASIPAMCELLRAHGGKRASELLADYYARHGEKSEHNSKSQN